MRIAWLGPAPTADTGGVPYASTIFLRGLAEAGVELDCYVATARSNVPPALLETEGLTFFADAISRHENRWHSRTPLASFVSGQTARAIGQARLVRLIARRHAERPYDLYYQFSQLELLTARRLRTSLPPIVLHPEVHAAGELRWHRRETELARRCEPRLSRAAARAMLMARAVSQKRDAALARMVIAVSREFAGDLERDYALPRSLLRTVHNPIDLTRFTPRSQAGSSAGPLELLFVSRLAVRKGVELVVELSHRLADLAGQVQITVVGDHSSWSDYRPLLRDLHAGTARYAGFVSVDRLPELYRNADALVQPSHYDPCPFTVGEALASGLPIIASDRVGSAEDVSPKCCALFPSGDAAAFEAAVREVIERLRSGEGSSIAHAARAEGERLFAPDHLARKLAGYLAEARTAA